MPRNAAHRHSPGQLRAHFTDKRAPVAARISCECPDGRGIETEALERILAGGSHRAETMTIRAAP
jgi:hypothetical protein